MAFERISLNIIPDGVKPVVHVSQFDVGRPIIIDLYNGDDAYTPAAGVTFELHCRKVDDNIVTLDTYEVDGNTITFASTEQLCACSGDNLCEIAILLDDLVMGTLNFILHVERDPLAGGCTSETSIYNLQQQIDDIITGEGYVKDTDLNILQSDWNEEDNTSPAYIKNKPSGTMQVQSDWTEADTTSPAYIKHKPEIPEAQVQSDWNEADNTKVDYIKNKPDLSIYAQSSDLAAVATSGDYDDLINKPTIPAAQVNSDWNSNSGVSEILNKPWVPVYTENEAPYQIRTTPAGNNRCLEKLVGVSCAFNQLVNTGDTSINTTSGHKYVTKINNVWSIISGGSAVTIVDDSSDMLIDLTACFGSEVADYLYTLEQNTAGSGISLFRQLFPEDYYAYQTAHLESSKPVSKVVVGVNRWDEVWELGDLNTINGDNYPDNTRIRSKNYVPIAPNTTYYYKCDYNSVVCFYDKDKNYINVGSNTLTANTTFTSANDIYYMRFSVSSGYGTTYNNDISINLPSTDHNYHAYESHTYPLGGDELRGILKVVDGQLVAYGDVKPSDGNGTEVFDIVDLSTLTFQYNSSWGCWVSDDLTSVKVDSNSSPINALLAGYVTVMASGYTSGSSPFTLAMNTSKMLFINNNDSANPPTGNLIYEKATPTAKSYTPFTNPMLCGATEEFTDSRSLKMFCGHDSLYYNSPFKGW